MPELPEVETTLRGISPHIVNRKVSAVVVRQKSLRWPINADLTNILPQKKLLEITRRGKYLLLRFSHGTLLMHLGMSGNLRIVDKKAAVEKHDHVDIVFGAQVLRFTDPRRFGAILWTQDNLTEHALLHHLGPEPLTDDFTADYLFQRTRKRSSAIKIFIMDSSIVVGVGNIYANEALFLANIKPIRKTGSLTQQNCEALVQHIKQVLAHAIQQGGTTLRDFVGGDGKPGYFKQVLRVYGRGGEPCVTCGKALKEIRLGQRSTVYCTVCQR